MSAKKFCLFISNAKKSFYDAFNAVFGKVATPSPPFDTI